MERQKEKRKEQDTELNTTHSDEINNTIRLNYDNMILEKDVEIENLKLQVVKLQSDIKYLHNSSSYSPIFKRYEDDIKELNNQILEQQSYINKLQQELLDAEEGIVDRSAQKIVTKLRNDLNKMIKEMMFYKNKEREYELNENRVNDLLAKLKSVTKENKKMKEEVKQTHIDMLSSDRNNENIDILTNENKQLKINNKNMKKEIKELKDYIVKLERERYKGKFMKLVYEKKNPVNVESDWKDQYANETLHRLLDRLKTVLIDNVPSALRILTNIENSIKEMEIELNEGSKREQNLYNALNEYINSNK